MINAKYELEFMLKESNLILQCAIIESDVSPKERAVLKVDWTIKDFVSFIEKMDFEYNRGVDDVRGTLWLSDNSWATKSIDSREGVWVIYNTLPIPPELY
jgi:hypothetical protein